MRYEIEVNGRRRLVNVHRANGSYVVAVDGREWVVDATRVGSQVLSLLMRDAGSRGAAHGGDSHEVGFTPDHGAGTATVSVGGVPVTVVLNGRRRSGRDDGERKAGPQRLVAPMPGKVVRVLAKVGDLVRARQPVVVVEAMKMENELRAARDGRVTEIAVRDGQSVEAGVLLAVVADQAGAPGAGDAARPGGIDS